MRADLRGKPPGDFAHGRQERQCGIRQLDGLIADANYTRFKHPAGKRFIRGQMQVGIDNLARLHPVQFVTDGLFDLGDHLGAFPDLPGVRDDFCAGRCIGLIGNAAAESGALFNHDAVVVGPKRGDARRNDGDALFIRFNFFRYSDAHEESLPVSVCPDLRRRYPCREF